MTLADNSLWLREQAHSSDEHDPHLLWHGAGQRQRCDLTNGRCGSLRLLGAATGRGCCALGRKETIEHEVDRTKTRDPALNQRDTDHGRQN